MYLIINAIHLKGVLDRFYIPKEFLVRVQFTADIYAIAKYWNPSGGDGSGMRTAGP